MDVLVKRVTFRRKNEYLLKLVRSFILEIPNCLLASFQNISLDSLKEERTLFYALERN